MFDVTRASTFEAVQKWKNDLDNKVILPNGSPVPVVLLANKVYYNNNKKNNFKSSLYNKTTWKL